ncbi:hypothetical protein NQ318_014441, partial [Aromia moschata]
MPVQKVAVVTGANKGIGFAIVKGLCEKFQGVVYLTSRSETKGKAAVQKLEELGFHPSFHQLDVLNQSSVDKFRDHIKTTHGGLDLLINNAGIMYPRDSTEPPLAEQAENTIGVNYYGTIRVCDALFPLLRDNAKVVNVSSSAGHLFRIPSAILRAKFANLNLTIPTLSNLMDKFVKDAKENKTVEEGWGSPPYCCYVVSKVGLSALTFIQQKNFDKETPLRNISINAVHPGLVRTDMNPSGVLTPEQGAKSTLYAVFEPNLKGKYIWFNCEIVDWYGERTPPR